MQALTFDVKNRYLYNEDGEAVAEIFEDHIPLGNRIVEALRTNEEAQRMNQAVDRVRNSLQAMLDGEDCDPFDMAEAMLDDLRGAYPAMPEESPLLELAKQVLLEEEQNPGAIPSDIVAGARSSVSAFLALSKGAEAAAESARAVRRKREKFWIDFDGADICLQDGSAIADLKADHCSHTPKQLADLEHILGTHQSLTDDNNHLRRALLKIIPYAESRCEDLQDAKDEGREDATSPGATEAWDALLIAKMLAERNPDGIPGLFRPQDPLESISRAYGEHQGLNANWSSRAWCVKGDTTAGIWILDDETPSTASLVLQMPDGESVKTLVSGSPDTILSVAAILRGIIHLPVSNPVPTGDILTALVDTKNTLIQAIEASGFSLPGPTDWRAAEDGEPKWVCNARLAISYSRIVIDRAIEAKR